MNIQQIKASLSLQTGIDYSVLDIKQQVAADKVTKEPWFSAWNNDKRIRVTLHADIVTQIQADKGFEGLALKREEVPQEGERLGYTRFVVITPKDVISL